MQMPKLSTVAASAWQHVLVFGPPKSGKTRLVGELAEHGYELVWFDLESGFNTLRQLTPTAQERINLIQLPDSPSYPIAVETCLKVIKSPTVPGTFHEICATHGKVACPVCKKDESSVWEKVNLYIPTPERIYVFDSVTQLVQSAVNHMRKGKPEDYKFEWDDWGALGFLMDRFLSHVQTAPAHIICISHETEVEMEDGKNKLVATAGTRNFSRNSAKYFDHVVYAEVKNKSHVAGSSTTYSNNILTGSRLAVATESSDKPTLIDIFKGRIGSAQVQPSVLKNLTGALKK
jgi:hypothetical protein